LALYEDNGVAQYTLSRCVSPHTPVPWIARNDKGLEPSILDKLLCNLADVLLPSIISVEIVIHGHLPSIRLGRADAFEWFVILVDVLLVNGRAGMGPPRGTLYRSLCNVGLTFGCRKLASVWEEDHGWFCLIAQDSQPANWKSWTTVSRMQVEATS
jgi:hypothetical protein